VTTGLIIMKEINFLPEWYRNGRRRQVSYRTQYAALGGIFLVVVMWNFVAVHSLSKARAEVARMTPKQAEAENVSREYNGVKNQAAQLEKKAGVLLKIDSRIDVASVLAEISFLIDKKIVLSKVEFKAEKFGDKQKAKTSGYSSSAVRAAGNNFAGMKALPLGSVRFKMVISGIASDASDVAKLICKLEDSSYFCQVYPLFSRDKKLKMGTNSQREGLQVTEFEIGCYLANYNETSTDG